MTEASEAGGLKILHLEDNPVDAELVAALLEQEGINGGIERVASGTDFEKKLRERKFDIILSDVSLPGYNGMTALELAKKIAPDTPFIFVSGTIGEEQAVASLRSGAVDYILKDRIQRLGSAILRAHKEALERQEVRRRDEEIRRQAEFLDQAQDAIFVKDLQQHITYWNKGAERVYGWKAEEVIGRRTTELMYRNGVPSQDGIFEHVLQQGEWQGELSQIRKDGREIVVASHRTLLRDQSGRPTAVLNINTDITEKKALEAQVLRKQRLESIGDLAAGVAHDLNNILSPILMTTELLEDHLKDPADLRMLEVSKSSVRRGADLVRQILEFSRGSKAGAGVTKVKAVIEDLAKLLRKTIPPSIQLQMEAPSETVMAAADSTQIYQVILNLCVNARDAMPRGGVLRVQAHLKEMPRRGDAPAGDYVELIVSDTGTGMPPEVKARIFEPFFTTKPEGKGTGLGLSTVATIARNLRGFVDVESEPGKGTTFRVYVPAKTAEREAHSEPVIQRAEFGYGESVLLVDDELALIQMTKQLLEANNYVVITASSAEEALVRMEEHPSKIAALITDLLMPGMNGMELIAEVSRRFPGTVTICLSGSADENWIRTNEVGAHAVLRKPCPTERLLAVMRRLLAEEREGGAAAATAPVAAVAG